MLLNLALRKYLLDRMTKIYLFLRKDNTDNYGGYFAARRRQGAL